MTVFVALMTKGSYLLYKVLLQTDERKTAQWKNGQDMQRFLHKSRSSCPINMKNYSNSLVCIIVREIKIKVIK